MTNREAVMPLVETIHYYRMGEKTTVCLIRCKNGFEIIGSTACAIHQEYDKQVGEYWAKEAAVEKLIQFVAFHLMQKKIENERLQY